MEIQATTVLIILQECRTPYNHFYPGDNTTVFYWAKIFGQTASSFIEDFENGSLDDWFQIKK